MQNEPLEKERRNYVRLDSVFPVQFRLLAEDGKGFLSEWLQGFTNNVSKGGICLAINNLKPEFAALIKSPQVKLALDISMPLTANPVRARAKIAWIREVSGEPNKFLVGLSYEEIDQLQNSRIMRYARAKRLFLPVVMSVIFVLGVLIIAGNVINTQLIKGNKLLIEKLVNITQEASIAKLKIRQLDRERSDLQMSIDGLQLRIQKAEEEKALAKNKAGLEANQAILRTKELNNLIERLAKEKNSLQGALAGVLKKGDAVSLEVSLLGKKRENLEKENFDKMYEWLKVHQNPRTGLVLSFEGDKDIADWAFIYDQSLAAQAYTNFSDSKRAKKIFDFFKEKAKKQGKLFFNAYYVSDGSPAEFIVHSGPNIWLGIAIIQYTKKTKDASYLDLAEDIAQGIIDLQNKDKDRGIRGGPGVEWFSTEHNLDAYAFFNMLFKFTGNAKYLDAANNALSWLVGHTYDKADLPVRRGKGDSTIATDTYAWSIAAVGPSKLEELGLDPDKIMKYAEDSCVVEAAYTRPDGRNITIKGFDFAPQKHVARGGVVSSEWTAQMVISLKIMADFYAKKNMAYKAGEFAKKASEYLSGLGNMIICSPSPSGQGESCLPYATQDFVDTGHGWITPKGRATGSVSATTYALFAYYNYNPLELKE